MGILDVFFIGFGLSMDACAVSMTNSMVYTSDRKKLKLMPVFFGAFQAIMPLAGFFAGNLFAGLIEKYAGIVAFVILAIIGANMIREAIKGEEEAKHRELSVKMLAAQAVATSIDAFATGVSFGVVGNALRMNIFAAAGLIGITTFCCSILALLLGKRFGKVLESKAEIFGGIILIVIGIKSLLGL